MISVKTARRNEKLIAYHKKYPNMSYAALGRVFKISRERVGQILGRKKGNDGRNLYKDV